MLNHACRFMEKNNQGMPVSRDSFPWVLVVLFILNFRQVFFLRPGSMDGNKKGTPN